jgi:hypothetical protein
LTSTLAFWTAHFCVHTCKIKKKSWEQFCLWTKCTECSYSCYKGILYIDVSLYLTLTIQAPSRLKRSANHLWNNSDACRKKFGEWSLLGVRRGDNLSPSLFKNFINDFPSYLDSCTDTVLLHSEKLNCLLYADDISHFINFHAGLQNRLHQLEKYCDDWCLKVNNKKTKITVFNN